MNQTKNSVSRRVLFAGAGTAGFLAVAAGLAAKAWASGASASAQRPWSQSALPRLKCSSAGAPGSARAA